MFCVIEMDPYSYDEIKAAYGPFNSKEEAGAFYESRYSNEFDATGSELDLHVVKLTPPSAPNGGTPKLKDTFGI